MSAEGLLIANLTAQCKRWLNAMSDRLLAQLSVADRMRRTLRTTHGRRCYAQRKAIVEPVFGQIKQGRGYHQFLLRGMRQVRGEWALICTTHNVLKLWTALRRRRPGDGLRALGRSQKAERNTQR